MSGRRLLWLSVTAVVLLGITAALTEAAVLHTDDGCAVEVHCTVCLWQATSIGITATTHVVLTELAACSPVVPAPANLHAWREPEAAYSRGPPTL